MGRPVKLPSDRDVYIRRIWDRDREILKIFTKIKEKARQGGEKDSDDEGEKPASS